MEFVQIAALVGGLLSIFSAIFSFKSVERRLGAEKILCIKLRQYLEENDKRLEHLKRIDAPDQIKIEVCENLKSYEKILSEILASMPNENKAEVNLAVNQNSEKGKVAYISRLFYKALAQA